MLAAVLCDKREPSPRVVLQEIWYLIRNNVLYDDKKNYTHDWMGKET